MPTEYPADFKQKVIKRYQNGESIKSLSHELHIAQGTLTAGGKRTVLSKEQPAPTHQRSLTPFQDDWQNWNMKWKSSAFLNA